MNRSVLLLTVCLIPLFAFAGKPEPKPAGLTVSEDAAAANMASGLINQWKQLAQATQKALDEGVPANPQSATPPVSADKLKKAVGPDAEKILREVAKIING